MTDSLRSAYDSAARTWGDTVSRLGYPGAYRALFEAVPPQASGHVLDAGCGTGAFARAYLTSAGVADTLTLLDTSPRMLAEAIAAFADAPVQTVEAGIGTSDIAPESADVLLCAHVIEHLPDPHAGLRWLVDRLRPGGQLYLVASRPHWCTALLRWKWGHRAFRESEVLAMLDGAGAIGARSFAFPAGPPSRTSRGYVAFRP